MMERHTPGPWEVHVGLDYTAVKPADPSSSVESIVPEVLGRTDEEIAANASLIAAAPVMLKALQAASMALKSYAYGNAATDLAEEVAQFCEAALSKAFGGPP